MVSLFLMCLLIVSAPLLTTVSASSVQLTLSFARAESVVPARQSQAVPTSGAVQAGRARLHLQQPITGTLDTDDFDVSPAVDITDDVSVNNSPITGTVGSDDPGSSIITGTIGSDDPGNSIITGTVGSGDPGSTIVTGTVGIGNLGNSVVTGTVGSGDPGVTPNTGTTDDGSSSSSPNTGATGNTGAAGDTGSTGNTGATGNGASSSSPATTDPGNSEPGNSGPGNSSSPPNTTTNPTDSSVRPSTGSTEAGTGARGTGAQGTVLCSEAGVHQVIQFNPNAALQKRIFVDGFVPNSSEFAVQTSGDQYSAQRAEHLNTGAVRVYYVRTGDWANVRFVGTTNAASSGLEQLLVGEAAIYQVIQFNPGASLQQRIFTDGFVPNSSEFDIQMDNAQYYAQRAEHLNTGVVRVYYVRSGDWANVQFVRC